MLSDFRKKKLTHFFNAYDADNNGYIDHADFTRYLGVLVSEGVLSAGSPKYKQLESETTALWNGIREYADTNRDNRVSLEEWLAWQEAIDADVEKGASFPFEKYAATFFDVMDTDGSGAISSGEYKTMLKAYGLNTGDADANFAAFDTNGDGSLSKEEVLQLNVKGWLSNDPNEKANYIFGKF